MNTEAIENVPLPDPDEEKEQGTEDLSELPEATFETLFGDEEEQAEFEYAVGEGAGRVRIRARRLQSMDQYLQLIEQSTTFRELCSDAKRCPPAWKPYLKGKMHKKTAMLIVFASTLILSPKLSQFQCLKIAGRKGGKLLEIAGPLLGSAEADATEGEDKEIEDAKND